MITRRPYQPDNIVDDLLRGSDTLRHFASRGELCRVSDCGYAKLSGARRALMTAETAHNRSLFFLSRVRHQQFEKKPVKLSLRQRVHTLVFNRILRGNHHEPVRQRVSFAIKRHAAFLHRFKQRRLRLGRGAVDLVSQQQIAKYRSACQRELTGLKVEQIGAQDIAWQEVRRKLNASEIETERSRETLRQKGLGCARRAFQEDVPLSDHSDQEMVDHFILTDDGLADFAAD